MSLSAVRVLPDENWTAEVVILVTTLGTKRTEYNAGKRARDLLEIKRVHYKAVDFNRDARQSVVEMQNEAIRRLTEEDSKYRKLQTDEEDDLLLPQLFLDGIFVGDGDDVQGLEDDGLLDDLLIRAKCPARVGKNLYCGEPRQPYLAPKAATKSTEADDAGDGDGRDTQCPVAREPGRKADVPAYAGTICPKCGTLQREILPEYMLIQDQIAEIEEQRAAMEQAELLGDLED